MARARETAATRKAGARAHLEARRYLSVGVRVEADESATVTAAEGYDLADLERRLADGEFGHAVHGAYMAGGCPVPIRDEETNTIIGWIHIDDFGCLPETDVSSIELIDDDAPATAPAA